MSSADKLVFACTILCVLAFASILLTLWIAPALAQPKTTAIYATASLAKPATTENQQQPQLIQLTNNETIKASTSPEPPPKAFQFYKTT